jgi:RimJ/RimL family protein N-acetyltransferase
MPWAAAEPVTLEDRVALLRRFRGGFDLDRDYVYAIFERDESAVVGGTGLHRRLGPGALEIGYWIRTSHAGAGLATEAAAALTRVAFELCGVDRVEIRVDPANERSCAIPRRLGFVEEATLRRRLDYPEPRDAVVYSLFRDGYAATPAGAAELEAFDAAGRLLARSES